MDSLHWILSRISWRDVLDIAIVTLVFFWFLVLIYQTRADQVLRGVVLLVVAAAVLASTLQLTVLGWLIVRSLRHQREIDAIIQQQISLLRVITGIDRDDTFGKALFKFPQHGG